MTAALSIVPTACASETRLRVAPEPLTDSELVARATGGDGVAFGKLVRRHRSAVLGFAVNVLRDPSEAQDVTQEAFARVFVKLPPSLDSFGAYMHTVVRNLCINRQRWAGRRRFVDVDEAVLVSEDDPSAHLERREDLATRRATAEAQLSPATRRVVLLLLDGVSRADVAARLGVTEGSVKVHVTRAADRLAPVGTRKPRRPLTYKGRSGTLATFAKEAGLSIAGLHKRLAAGMTLTAALETPAVRGPRKLLTPERPGARRSGS